MATLQKFKLLATQCAVAGSPTRSPASSPVIHLRRRKTLRMLLGRAGGGGGRRLPPDRRRSLDRERSQEKDSELSISNKLRDLFVSSPPALGEGVSENGRECLLPSGGDDVRRGGGRLLRPISATFRQRLLRRAWRPVLVGIPE
ncbi:50S ribosomal protein-related [Striga asiatica]|uniref:50S ribosomal protein-related n=1 Tax=Striga asiatica TaxID=4170 RepID=A0A5A7QS62_STRAF|nr:50S ribosomal protein-related [Striga asiatica]